MKNIQPKTWRLWAVEIITALLLVFFVHSAIDNYFHFISLKNLLGFYTRNVTPVAWGIIITEVVITTLLFIPQTRLAGLIAAFLSVTALTIIVELTPHAPHFFGGILNYLGKRYYLPFEITVLLITLIAIVIRLAMLQRSRANRLGTEKPEKKSRYSLNY